MVKQVSTSPPLANRSSETLVAPDERILKRLRNRLRPFQPLNLREIISEAKASGKLSAEQVRKKRADAQIRQLLQILGLQADESPNWEQAFYRLAVVLLGVDHVIFTPRRGKGSSLKWDELAQILLFGMMYRLTKQGLSERKAIEAIAADPTRWGQLPEIEQRKRPRYGGKIEQSRRKAALWRQWTRVKKDTARLGFSFKLEPGDPIPAIFGGETPESPLERIFQNLELAPLLGKSIGDKRQT